MTPRTVAHQAPLSMDSPGKNTGVGAIPFSRGPSRPRDQTHVSCTGRWVLYAEPSGKPWGRLRSTISVAYYSCTCNGRPELPLKQGRDLEQSSSPLALLSLGAGSSFVMGAATCIVGHSKQHPSSLHTRCQRHFTCPGSHDQPKCLQTLSNVPRGATSHTRLRISDSGENIHERISPLHYACASAF